MVVAVLMIIAAARIYLNMSEELSPCRLGIGVALPPQ